MNISRDDARMAIDSIAATEQRVFEHHAYRNASPFLLLWGAIWFGANSVVHFTPQQGGLAWMIGVGVGLIGTILLVVQQSRRGAWKGELSATESKRIGRRAAFIGITLWAYFPAMLIILAPHDDMQVNAFISLSWAFIYMVSGAWVGTRMFVTGLITAIAVLVGFFLLKEHYFLWMAFVGGGALMAASLWLRKL